MRALLLGIDLGTSAVKAALFDRSNVRVASASSEYATLHPAADAAEQEPVQWWRAVCQAVRALLDGGVAAAEVKAIGLSGQMHGTVLLGADGRWSNAIIWQDRRSAAAAEAIRDAVGATHLVQIAGSPIAAGFQAATLRWLSEHEPARLAQASHVLLPKDWLGWRMTGAIATDPSDAAGTLLYDTNLSQWSEALLAASGAGARLMPVIEASSALRGGLTEDAGHDLGLREGTPVVIGAADAACALLAAGGVDESTLLLNLSTGGQLVQALSSPLVDRAGRLHTFRSALPAGKVGGWYLMGATLAAGHALRWWRQQVAGDLLPAYDDLLAPAAEIAPGSDGLIFLPYLVGERTPHMDAGARGAFLGLRDHHRRAHMTRAVLEGATFATYEAFLTMREVAPMPAGITLAGGGARSPLWRQIAADIFGLPVRPLLAQEQSAWGAALLAGEGIGWWQARDQAVASVELGGTSHPQPEARDRYMALFPCFQDAYAVNRTLFHALGRI